jgi:FKBP-type peptidyl-prolyl cis-trans isomerase (trigger factor)
VPELDEAFAQERAQKSLAELKEEIAQQGLERKRREDRDARLEAVFSRLLSENHIPVPEALAQAEAARELEQWNKFNVPEAEREELLQTQATRIDRKVKNALVLQQVIELERIEATDADYRRRYEALAPLYGKDPATVQQFYQSQPRLQQSLRNDILENKAIDLLLDSNPSLIVEV